LVKGGVAVARVAADATRSASPNKGFGASHFRSYRGCHNTVGISQILFILDRLRRTDGIERMTSARLGRKVRSIKMSAQNTSASRSVLFEPATSIQKIKVLFVAGDRGRGQQTGCAVTEVRLANSPKGLVAAVHEIGAGPAMNVQVYEPWREIAVIQLNHLAG
jgi:hypothetical protein